MVDDLIRYNNPAGRLLEILKRLSQKAGQSMTVDQFAIQLGVEPNWSAVFSGIVSLNEECSALDTMIMAL